jgi:hypothetical protein
LRYSAVTRPVFRGTLLAFFFGVRRGGSMYSVKLAVGFWLVCELALAGSAEMRIVLESPPTTESAGRELVSTEAFKLLYGAANPDPVVQIPSGLALDSALRDRLETLERERLGQLAAGKDLRPKGPLTLTQVLKAFTEGRPLAKAQVEELLSVLRVQDSKDFLSGSAAERARALLLGELEGWARDGSKPIPLPAALKEAIAKEIRSRAAKEVPPKVLTDAEVEALLKQPAIVVEIASSLPVSTFSLEDWMRFGGNLRIAGRVEQPNRFFADLRSELGSRLAEVSPRIQKDRGVQAPRVPFVAPRPSFQVGSAPCPAPKGAAGGRGFHSQPNFRGEGGAPGKGGVVQLDGPLPKNLTLDSAALKRLKEARDLGHKSLQLVTHYPKSPSASCQVTLVGNPGEAPPEVGEGRCSYNAITARHCVEGERDEFFTHAEIPPFKEMAMTRLKTDDSGGDLAMMAFEAECRSDLPTAPLAMIPPREGEGIVVHAAVPLVGQALSNGGTDNRMMMNVRDPENGGIGIEQGNSGGAVLNENGEIVGVISSKIDSSDGQGIGFFATRKALYFANQFLNPEFELANLGGSRGGNRSPASHNGGQ